MRRLTGIVVRHRRIVLLCWVALLVAGAAGAANVGSLLSNQFTVPGSPSQDGLTLLHNRFHARSDGAFTLVAQAARPLTASDLAAIEAAAQRGARELANGKAGPVRPANANVAYAEIDTSLQNSQSADRTAAVRQAIGTVPGLKFYLTGLPAINHDTTPLYGQDLARGEEIALPIAILVMGYMFGSLVAMAVPLLFALFTIATTLGCIWVIAHAMTMATYVTNVVTLIGIAIAIDYSMLVVFRFREELAHTPGDSREALMRTMETAGRATVFSGLTVAVGLALLALMPLPFIRSMGIGGLLIPLVSIAAAVTLLPAMLSLIGARINRFALVRRSVLERRTVAQGGFWTRLARAIMRYPIPILVATAAFVLAVAAPAIGLHLTGGDTRGYPTGTQATDGLSLLKRTLGAGSLAPNQILIDTGRPGGAIAPSVAAAERRLVAMLAADPAINRNTIAAPFLIPGSGAAAVARAQAADLLDRSLQIAQIRAAAYGDSGTSQSMDLVKRIRNRYIPAAAFGNARVLVTGAPAFGVDFIAKAYGAFPWLVAAVLVLSYLLLLRAFRSVFLPIKAVFMNLLSVSATYGVLVLFFQHGWGETLLGLQSSPQIEAWIPIFLFAVLFGLSMDYEVFLLTRMREEWDRTRDNDQAVVSGLEHTGRIITAAAIVMIAAFSGFTSGRFVAFQEFGIGLSAAILLDATLIRAVIVPATMKLLGRWNWYLPDGLRRAMRLQPAGESTH
jgi:RND superfamily putative drug exporter